MELWWVVADPGTERRRHNLGWHRLVHLTDCKKDFKNAAIYKVVKDINKLIIVQTKESCVHPRVVKELQIIYANVKYDYELFYQIQILC